MAIPRAVAYISRLPESILAKVNGTRSTGGLFDAQLKPRLRALATCSGPARAHPAWIDAGTDGRPRINVGWAIVWTHTPVILSYLQAVGFRFDYRADGALVYRLEPRT